MLARLLREIVVRQYPRVDDAQNVLGPQREQACYVRTAMHADDRHAALVAASQRKLVVVPFVRDLAADVCLRDAQQTVYVTHDGLERKSSRHLQVDQVRAGIEPAEL